VGLVDELQSARWFGGKNRAIREARIVDRACWVDEAAVCLVEVAYVDGRPEVYVLADRFGDPGLARRLLDQFAGASIASERGGSLEFRPTHAFGSLVRKIQSERSVPISLMRGEQSNSSICFGDVLILKLFRRVQFGPNPDVEVGVFLTEHSHFRGTPEVAGSLEYTSPDGQTASLALLQRYEPNRGDAWRTTQQRLRAVLDGGETIDSVAAMARLGETTADLHLALASGTERDFSPEPISAADIQRWRHAIRDEVRVAAEALSKRQIGVDAYPLLHRADGIAALEGALKTRHHGDYHLGQVLERDDGSFVIIDFEGEPSKPLAQRREKYSPLRDVAGMLRSLDYARNAALRDGDASDPQRVRRAAAWHAAARDAFLTRYLDVTRQRLRALLPSDVHAPLAALELEKAAYEILYELNNRPDWLPIPLAALF
jgi:trehalose synthase-fused probable maltokinase